MNKIKIYEDKIEKLNLLNKRLMEDDRLTIKEWMQLLISDKCSVISNDKGICVYAEHNNIIYIYYIISYQNNSGFFKELIKEFEKNYQVIFSVHINNERMLDICRTLGYSPNLTYDNRKEDGISNYYLMSRIDKNLSINEKESIKYLKNTFVQIHNDTNLRVVFDLDDTITTMDTVLYSELGLFGKYDNPNWDTINERDKNKLMEKYLDTSTYDREIDIDIKYLELLVNILGKENVIIYSHCLSPEIASFKYNWIKEKLNNDISIVFSFDGQKPPIDCLVIVEDSFTNIKSSNAKFSFYIKKFYNKGKFEINQAVESILNNILFKKL